jgi:hypothetical protein
MTAEPRIKVLPAPRPVSQAKAPPTNWMFETVALPSSGMSRSGPRNGCRISCEIVTKSTPAPALDAAVGATDEDGVGEGCRPGSVGPGRRPSADQPMPAASRMAAATAAKRPMVGNSKYLSVRRASRR